MALISHASKVMLKVLQASLQQYVNCELPYVQAGFGKGRGTRDRIATSAGSSKKQESSRQTSISALLTMPKPLTVWITINCGQFFKGYEIIWPVSWETCMQVRKQQLELNIGQQTGSSWKTLEEAQTGIKIAGRNINYLRYADDTTLMAESEEELKSLLMKVEEESEKGGLKLNIQKTKIIASGPITSCEIDGETVSDFIFFGSKITAGGGCSHEIKRHLLQRNNNNKIKKNKRHSLEGKLWPT